MALCPHTRPTRFADTPYAIGPEMGINGLLMNPWAEVIG